MTQSSIKTLRAGEGSSAFSTILVMACWFGLVAGAVEGLALFAVFGLGYLNSNIRAGVSLQIVWISTVVSLVIFLGIGVVVGSVSRIFTRVPLTWIFGLFCFLTFLDWTAVTGRLGPLAVLVLSAGLTITLTRWFSPRTANVSTYFRKTLPWIAVAAVLLVVGVEGGQRIRERRAEQRLAHLPAGTPNVLVIVMDTVRADHVSLYGYERPTTPNLQQIAREGVTFDNDIAASSWTLPSHASMLTGRYPHEHGADGETPLDTRYPTLSEALRQHGYRTAGFSANLFYFTRRGGFARGFIHFEDYFYSLGDMFFRTLWGRIANRYAPDSPRFDELPTRKRASEVNRELIHWIDQDRSKPFFAFINYFDAHEPYMTVPEYRDKFRDHLSLPPVSLLNHNDQQVLRKDNPYLFRLSRMSPPDFQEQVDNYDRSILYMDAQIGNLFTELKDRGMDRNTLVIITSDHGEAFRDHGLLTHRNALYRELIHVPLVYWWPGRIPANVRVDRPVTAVSLPATIVDLLGVPDARFPVPSLARLWTRPDQNPGWRDPISELAQNLYIPKSYPASKGWMKAIVGPQWHLIVSQNLPPELYHWTSDDKELQNLASGPQADEVLSTLTTELWSQVDGPKPNQPAKPASNVALSTFTK